MKRTFLVEVEIPTGVGILEMKDEIEKAVRVIPGYFTFEDDMFYMDRDKIDVQNATIPRVKQLLKRIGGANDV